MTNRDLLKENTLDTKRRELSARAQEVAGLEDIRDNVIKPRRDSVEKFLTEQVAPAVGAPFRALAERYPQQAQALGQSPIVQNLLTGLGAYSRYVVEPSAELGGRIFSDAFMALPDIARGQAPLSRTPEFIRAVGKKAGKSDLLTAAADATAEIRYSRDSYFLGERVLGSLVFDPLNFLPVGGAFKALPKAAGQAIIATTADRAAMKLGIIPDRRGLIGKALTLNNSSVANYTEGLAADTVASFALPHIMKTAAPEVTLYGQLKDFTETSFENLYKGMRADRGTKARMQYIQGVFQKAKILDRIDETMLPEDIVTTVVRASQEWVRRETGQLYTEKVITLPTGAPKSFTGKALKGLGTEAPTETRRMTPDVFNAELAAGVEAKDPIWLAIRDAQTLPTAKERMAAELKLRDMGVRVQEQGMTKLPNPWYRMNQRIRSEFSVLWLTLNPGWHIGNYSTNMLALGLEGGFDTATRTGAGQVKQGMWSTAKLMGIKTEVPRAVSYSELQGIRSLEQQATFGQVMQSTAEDVQLRNLLQTSSNDTIIESFLRQIQAATGGKQSTVESFIPKPGRDLINALRAAGSTNENSAKRALFEAVVREVDQKNLRSALAGAGYVGVQADNVINLVVQHGREGALKRLGAGAYDAADLIDWGKLNPVVHGHLKAELEAVRATKIKAGESGILTADDVRPVLQKVRGITAERGQVLRKLAAPTGTFDDIADLGEEAVARVTATIQGRTDLGPTEVAAALKSMAGHNHTLAREREMSLVAQKFERSVVPYMQSVAHGKVARKFSDEAKDMREYVQLHHFMIQERHIERVQQLANAGRYDEIARENSLYYLQAEKLFSHYEKAFTTWEKEFEVALEKAGAPIASVAEARAVAATMPPITAATSPTEVGAKSVGGWAFNTDRETLAKIIQEAGLPREVVPGVEPTAAGMARYQYARHVEDIDTAIGNLRNPALTAPPKAQELAKVRRALEGSRTLTQQQAVTRTEEALFNYGLNTNMDFAFNHIAPFPFWSTRTLLSMALRVGLNPQNMARTARLAKLWWEDSKDKPRSAFMAEKVYTMPDGTEILIRPYTLFVPMGRPALELIHEGSDPNETVGWQDITKALKQMSGLNPYFYTELALGHVFGTEASGFGVFRSPEQMVKDLVPQQRVVRGLVGQLPEGAKFLEEGPLNVITKFSPADKYRFVYTIRDAVRTNELSGEQAEIMLQSISDGAPTDEAYVYIARAMRDDSKRLFGMMTPKGPLPGAFFGTAIVPIRVTQKEAREVFNKYFEVDENGIPKLDALQKEAIRKEWKHLFVGRSFLPPADLPAEGKLYETWQDTADYWHQVEQASDQRLDSQEQIDRTHVGKAWIDATQEINSVFKAKKLGWHNPSDGTGSFPSAAISTDERNKFNTALGKKSRPEHPLDVGYQNFVSILADPDFHDANTGEPKYNELNAAIDAYNGTASPEQKKYNKQRLERDRTKKERAYFKAREDTKPYWEAWKTLPENLGMAYQVYQAKRSKNTEEANMLAAFDPYVRLAIKMVTKRREYLAKSDPTIRHALAEFWSTGPEAIMNRKLAAARGEIPSID